MTPTDPIQLTAEQQTLFITLCAKALDYRSDKPILRDGLANSIVEQVGVDVSRYATDGNVINVIRAKQLDDWTKEFVANNENAVVICLGCGLDTRFNRIDLPKSITWFDVDYSEVINLRKKFFADKENYRMIGRSITDPGLMEEIPTGRPALVVAEGVLEYLSAQDVKMLFDGLIGHLPHGQIIFDIMNSFAITNGNKQLQKTSGAVLKWSVEKASEIDKIHPQLKRLGTMPVLRTRYIRQLGPKLRTTFGILRLLPRYKRMMQLIRCEFKAR